MKKVLFGITSLGLGGAERVLVDLCNELSKEYDITIFTIYSNGEMEKQLSTNVKIKSLINKRYIDLTKWKKIWKPIEIMLFKNYIYKIYLIYEIYIFYDISLERDKFLIQQIPLPRCCIHRINMLYKSFFDHHDLVAEDQCLVDAVGHEHDAGVLFLLDTEKLFLHLLPRKVVKSRKWFIH